MGDFELMKEIVVAGKTKIVLLVMDGLGGLPLTPGGPTELEAARTPHLDRLAREGICGLTVPIDLGITPGSGPAHLALFGYDPVACRIGRGVLEAVGIDFDLTPNDVAARGNFCTIDENGLITDRRAGRISTEKAAELCAALSSITLSDSRVEVFVQVVKEHRFVVVFRGEGLSPAIEDTDPQETGLAPYPARPGVSEARATADLVNEWLDKARRVLAGYHPANMVTLRGFSKTPDIPQMGEIYKLKCGAIAGYPMYRGLAKLVGMTVLDTGETLQSEFETLTAQFDKYDFFYLHVKKTDSYGEDGNFDAKVRVIEEVDALVPSLMALKPDVVAVTGDHSSPALLKAHSWHPVPTLVWSAYCRADAATGFSEKECVRGGLGNFPATGLMPLLMANALRLNKFGA